MVFDDKVVLITGGTGTFGRAMVNRLLDSTSVKKIIVFSRDEFKQFHMAKDLEGVVDKKRLRFFIGDVRDKDRLSIAMRDVDVVFHAAALKQIPICEYNPFEAVMTNIDGAKNVIDAAIENRVSRVVALSSDKAVSPINLYGATKLVAEKLFVDANVFGAKKTRFCCVRYGNIIGSRGSVVQEFEKQAESGTIYITDKEMTRFWWNIDQATMFVINALVNMKGGEIFIPKLNSTKVRDLAIYICPHCRVHVTGKRPGEKIHEVLIVPDEMARTNDIHWAYSIVPENKFFEFEDDTSLRVDGNWSYTSKDCLHDNPQEFIKEILME